MVNGCGLAALVTQIAQLWVLAVAAPAAGALAEGDSAYAAARALAGGDSAYARANLALARSRYATALSAAPDSFPALWRLARAESEMAEDATGAEQKQLIASAELHARAAISVAPDSAAGHEWLAVVLGRKALHEGPKARLAMAREIKTEVDRALELNPSSARAWHVRGRWNRELASLNLMERLAANTVLGGVPKGASMENAVRDLERAVALDPGFINHHLELGRTYLQLHRTEEARRELTRAASLTPGASPRDARYQQEARELLARLPAPPAPR
jgi:tetratricopeptide (TPR) repeat protein